jgi:hypothetical protein
VRFAGLDFADLSLVFVSALLSVRSSMRDCSGHAGTAASSGSTAQPKTEMARNANINAPQN